MIKDELRGFLKTTSAYFGLEKYVSDMRFNLWFDEVRNIPSESLPFIQSSLFTEKDSMPRNIPKTMKRYFAQWLSANPNKLAYQYSKTPCDDCGSDGIIFFIKPDGYRYAARCASCQNWKQTFVGGQHVEGVPKMMGIAEIERMGWTIL